MDAGGEATSRLVAWLRRAGLNSLAADFLEAAGPLAPLGAQLSYLVDPFVHDSLETYGRLLEDPAEVQKLVQRLRSEQP
jgi:hypothetical protein